MKILKVLGIILLLIFAAAAGLFLTASDEATYEQSIEIDAPVEAVWSQTKSLELMDKWSPWTAKDPNIKQTWNGTEGEVGSENCWESDIVGVGCQSILEVEAPNRMHTKMVFTKPYAVNGTATVNIEPTETGSKATWSVAFLNEGVGGKIFSHFNDMEANLKEDFTTGLAELKEMSEAVEIKPEPQERAISADELPETIRTYIAENHADAEIVEAEEITLGESVSYDVEMKMGEEVMELSFNSAGELIPDDEDGDDSEDDSDE
jgi:hypothetical protein